MTHDIFGADLHPGDTIDTATGPHRIDRLAEYPARFVGDHARRAFGDEGHWCATVADHEKFHLLID